MMLRFLFLYSFSLFSLSFYSQELPPFKNFNPSDYQGGNQNWGITQDDNGHIYVANNEGLLTFNGSRWCLKASPNGSIVRSTSFIDDRVYTGMYMDFGYWVKSDNGELEYNSIVQEGTVDVLEDEQFWTIVDTGDYILFQSLNAIYSYKKTTGETTRIIESSNVWKLFKVNDTLYYQVLNEGLFQIVNNTGQIVSTAPIIKDNRLISLFSYDNQVRFVTENGKIGALQAPDNIRIDLQSLFSGLKVYSSQNLEDGSLVLGTVAHGLVSLTADGKIDFVVNKTNGLANNTVLSLLIDRDYNLWSGLDNGISFLNLDSQYRTYVDERGTLGTIYDSAIHDENIYIASNQGVFYRALSDQSSNYQLIENTTGQAWSLDLIDNNLLCGHDNGLFLIEEGTATIVFNEIGVWNTKQIYSDEKFYAVLGTYSGLYTLEKLSNGKYKSQRIEGFNISSRDFEYFDDYFFINHEYKGVYRLTVGDSFNKSTDIVKIEGIEKSPNSDITMLEGSNLLYINQQGVFRFDSAENRFLLDASLSESLQPDGYSSGRMISTSDGSNWLFTQNSLLRIKRQKLDNSLDIERFNLAKDARNEMTGYENIISLNNDQFLIGTANGYIVLNTAYDVLKEHSVSIEKVNAIDENGKLINALDKSSYPNTTNSFRFWVNDPLFDAIEPLVYQYRITGYQDYWSEWQESPMFQIDNMPSGDYKIEFRSKLGDSLSNNSASFEFSVEKPFYATIYAIIFYIFFLGMCVLAVNLFYRNYYKKKKAKELEKQQRELELVQLTSQKEMTELRNEKLRDEIKYRNNELAVSTMGMLRKNEALTEISNAVKKLPQSPEIKQLKKLVEKNLTNKQEWISFEEAFNNADKDFFKKLKAKHDNLTTGDLRLCTYLRLNLASKEIAPLLNISPRSVEIKRYRLRKKLGLLKDDSLIDYILDI